MTEFRAAAARLLRVSDDTVRRWIDRGTPSSARSASGRAVVDGLELARLLQGRSVRPEGPGRVAGSARHRFVGLVTEVVPDTVVSRGELRCGPHRVVPLMSTGVVRDPGPEPGCVATAVATSTDVVVETPGA